MRITIVPSVALVLGLTGCATYVTETRVVLDDPSQVAMEAGPEREIILPAGGPPAEVLLEEGRISTGESTAADFKVHARRETDGTMALRWETHLPLRDGELRLIWPEDGAFTGRGPAKDLIARGDELRLGQCATLHRTYGFHGAFTGYGSGGGEILAPGEGCAAENGAAGYSLVTPWTNVREIRQTTRPTISRLTAITVLPLALSIIGGGVALALADHPTALRRAGGGIIAGLGIAMELPFASAMFARTKEVVIPARSFASY